MCVGGALLLTPLTARAQHGHGHSCDPETAVAEPILSVSDFDGDGIVGESDVHLVAAQVQSGDYIAFYDRNADYQLDGRDIAATARDKDAGAASTAMDQQLAAAFWGSVAYRNRDDAIADSFIPFTPAFFGHGEHWAVHADTGLLDYRFDAGTPQGLNYDTDGNLWAVFYYFGANPNTGNFNPLAQAPAGFDGHEDMWHHHAGACLLGIDYNDPRMAAEDLNFVECVGPGTCGYTAYVSGYGGDFRWNPQFYMLHVWLYELNPCGTFAGAHPDLEPNQPDPGTANPTGHACSIGDKVDANNDGYDDQYPYSPVPQFCRWMAEIGQSIPQLGCF
jgi:hypothetical protein